MKLFYGDHFNLNFAFVTTDMLGDIQIAVTHPTENKFAFHFIDLSLRENKQNLIQGNKQFTFTFTIMKLMLSGEIQQKAFICVNG